jgi:hypothetical protein
MGRKATGFIKRAASDRHPSKFDPKFGARLSDSVLGHPKPLLRTGGAPMQDEWSGARILACIVELADGRRAPQVGRRCLRRTLRQSKSSC